MKRRAGSRRTLGNPLECVLFGWAALLAVAAAPSVRADAVAYLVNVTVRPGYNFANAEAALNYGYGVCDKVSQGRTYAQVIGDVKAELGTSDEYQASYLIAQAVNELCPALIWRLRNSAAHYWLARWPADGSHEGV